MQHNSSRTHDNSAVSRAFQFSPPYNYVYISLLGGAFLLVYFRTLFAILEDWYHFHNVHGLLILGISLFFVFTKRTYLHRERVEPALTYGFAVMGLGCLMLIAGNLGAVLLLQQLSLIVVLLGLVLLCLGVGYLKILLLPIGYLIFMFPIFEEFLDNFSAQFELVGAHIASTTLRGLGLSVLREGAFIHLPHVTLQVGKLCNGINQITALVSLAIPLGYFTQKGRAGMLTILVAAFCIGILSNGIRIALIGIWTSHSGSSTVHGPFNLLYSSVVYLMAFGLLGILTVLAGRSYQKNNSVKTVKTTRIGEKDKSPLRLRPPLGIAITMLMLTAAFVYLWKPEPVRLAGNLEDFPRQIGNWHGQEIGSFNERFDPGLADQYLVRIYEDGKGNRIKLYVGHFIWQRKDREVVNFRYDWFQQNPEPIQVSVGSGKVITVRKTQFHMRGDPKTFFVWYLINGRPTSDRYVAKLMTILNGLMHRKTDGTIVIIASENIVDTEDRDPVAGFIELFYPILGHYISSAEVAPHVHPQYPI